ELFVMVVAPRKAIRRHLLLCHVVLAPERRELAEVGRGHAWPWIALQSADRRRLCPPSIAWRGQRARPVHGARARLLPLEQTALVALADQHREAQPSQRASAFELVSDVENIPSIGRIRRLELMEVLHVLREGLLRYLHPWFCRLRELLRILEGIVLFPRRDLVKQLIAFLGPVLVEQLAHQAVC